MDRTLSQIVCKRLIVLRQFQIQSTNFIIFVRPMKKVRIDAVCCLDHKLRCLAPCFCLRKKFLAEG